MMKRIIALALSVLMILSCFVGCKGKTNEDLANAVAYLENMYQKGDKDETMEMLLDTDVISVVTIDGVAYDVEWSITVTEGASDAVKVSESSVENHVMIDVPDVPENDILFTAIATVKDKKGNTAAAEFEYKVIGIGNSNTLTFEEILTQAYELEEGKSMEGTHTLTGKIVSIDTPYSADYKNVTVTIEVDGFEDKPIVCFRLEGEGADEIVVGDYITVTGTIVNYKGTVEFDAKCTLDEVVKGDEVTETPDDSTDADADVDTESKPGTTTSKPGTTTSKPGTTTSKPGTTTSKPGTTTSKPDTTTSKPGTTTSKPGTTTSKPGTTTSKPGTTTTSKPGATTSESKPTQTVTDVAKIMKDAIALEHEAKLSYISVLTGKVIAIDTPYDEEYGNITVTIKVNGYDENPVQCYRLTGTGVEKIQKNDTITVSGVIKKYNKTIEFEFGCTMTKRISGGGVKQETDPAKIMEAAYALEPGSNLGYEVTLTGKVTSIDSFYDATYDNISVWISVAGKDLLCYRMKGNNIKDINVGDTLTVTGMIKNYNGKIEFDQGCTMRKREATGKNETAPTDPKKIVDAAFALEPNKSLSYQVTLTGPILEINTEYSSQYNNITVTIEVEGSDGVKELKCYRMKGEGAESLAVGDVITVTGKIKNYQHSSGDCEVEFDAGCTFVKK